MCVNTNARKQQRYDDVRAVYRDIAFKNIDWPEAIFDSWLTFEHMYGTVRSIQDCIDRTERAQKIAYARRMKVCLQLPMPYSDG